MFVVASRTRRELERLSKEMLKKHPVGWQRVLLGCYESLTGASRGCSPRANYSEFQLCLGSFTRKTSNLRLGELSRLRGLDCSTSAKVFRIETTSGAAVSLAQRR